MLAFIYLMLINYLLLFYIYVTIMELYIKIGLRLIISNKSTISFGIILHYFLRIK